MLDCSELTYRQMADLVRAIRIEVKNRNPILVNAYTGAIDGAIFALEEIAEGEADNFTSESGPKEPPKGKE